MNYKKILTVQDVSCVGQCSLTVALPILSVCGFETCVLPCSVLSNHTTGFDEYTFKDLSSEMGLIQRRWVNQNIKFSAVYSGYIGNVQQLENLKNVINTCLEPDATVIIDPAMADNGVLYPGFDSYFVNKVKEMASYADYLLPNVTEACLLTDTTYQENYDETFIKELMNKLASLGCPNIVVTGVSFEKSTTGVAIWENGNYNYCKHSRIDKSVPGTGDVFASVFTGAILKGHSIQQAAVIASDFVLECLKETIKYPQHSYGPVFEPMLYKLANI